PLCLLSTRSHYSRHLRRLSLFFFFLHSSPHHPDLHSFPTRRSSDLRIELGKQQHAKEIPLPDEAIGPRGSHLLTPRAFEVDPRGDRKSTRLNSSHVSISYAVFCLKKKKKKIKHTKIIK